MSKEPEELVELGKTTVTVGGMDLSVAELENEGLQKNVTKLKKIGDSPKKIISDINENLTEILTKPNRIGPQDSQLKELILECKKKLEEIEKYNNQ